MARCAGLLRNRLNERRLLSWAQTKESLRTADSSSPVIAVIQPAHALDHKECLFPVSPEPASYDPEKFVDGSSLGLGCWRLKTASCWRRARFSSIRLRRVRNRRSTAPSQSRNRSNMATKL